MNKNIHMTVLKAIGIIVVVSCHLEENMFNIIGIPLSLSRELFPEYSYHIPLFVFASGYFYKRIYESDYKTLVKKRFANIRNYYRSNLFYLVLSFILVSTGLLTRNIEFSLFSFFVEPFLGGFQFYFNGPGWFVPFLFTVRIMYPLFRKGASYMLSSFKQGEEKDFRDELIFTVFLCVIGVIAAYFANKYPVENQVVKPYHAVLRTLWGLQYMQIGLLFREFLEKYLKYNIYEFVMIVASKVVFYMIFGYSTFSLRTVSFYGNNVLGLVTSIIGILYVLYLSKFICRIVDGKYPKVMDFIVFIGDNTWSVMIHHLLVKWTITQMIDAGMFSGYEFVVTYFVTPILCLLLPLRFVYVCKIYRERKSTQPR
ncbi:hypothetical protein EXD82_06340 [Peptacetobacter hominis]|uniref:Acyltransferase 3 domain-containing protein n=1 Tax=Peptacetobacter hominis TaxID=2743610 RepID=A0A544QUR4_9FIRM|nr:acyltransferase family protein [Peptacetobacter hominis]TQQ84420.1 hypothetical protein EXD82_06340 [Peptacetobacter hominis]